MQQTSTSIFHSFSRLPLELRIQIWSSAITENRPLKIRLTKDYTAFWSPTPVPAVTRANHESRKHCSYQKAFIFGRSPCYIWTRFDSDIVQMLGSVMFGLTEGNSIEKREIRHLRIEMSVGNTWDEADPFYHKYSYRIRDFPRLERCDILVSDRLHVWGIFIKERYWGACPRGNVRIVDAKTGEYIDEETGGPYQDYLDTGYGEHREYVRIDDDWDEEEDGEERYETMMKMSAPLPRIDLNY